MANPSLAVGQIIELNDRRRAVIRFLGPTAFAPGEWIGVELEEATGKNDGSVKGDRYFDCDINYGMFLREAGVGKIVEQAPGQSEPPSKKATNGAARAPSKSRPSTIGAAPPGRTPVVDPKRRESALASLSGTISPSKSPTKQLGTGSSAPSRTSTPPGPTSRRPLPASTTANAATTKTRPSLSTTPSVSSRRISAISGTPASAATARTAASRPAARGQTVAARTPARTSTTSARQSQSLAPPRAPSNRLSSVASNASDDRDSSDNQPSALHSPLAEGNASLLDVPAIEPSDVDLMPPPSLPAKTPHPASSQRVTRPSNVPSREVEDLQAKMRILERKRLEDRERLKKLADMEQERDRYASVMQKLQTKLQTQSQELAELRKQLAESESSLLDVEAIQAEHDSILEMATLDREMAEENAEVLKTEVEALRSKNEEMALELEILREENQELGREMSSEERTSQGWMQMERSNERLREALLRLRDVTQEQEAELKDQIKSLEEDAKDAFTITEDYDNMKAKMLATEADMDDLRQQLDAALGAEDMIEELTERNMTLQEDVEELRDTVEDLENLKELNDELEVNHVEAEKQMLEEIDFKNSLINDSVRRSAQQQQTIEDCEYTISRFRDLVTNLQTDLEDMRASQQITGKEAEELSSRSRAMMDLNTKLQISASKTQVKTIDLELKRLDAEEASEHLAIVQLFLPEVFHAERDSILALLRFKRVGFKANLLHTFVKEKFSSQAVSPADGHIFAGCSVMDRLTWISAMGERFVKSISSCSVQDFAKYEGALYELEPVERALNNYIEALKKGDLDENKVDGELQRSMAVMSHLASIHIRESLPSAADHVLMQTSLVQSHLETASSALSLSKTFIQNNVPETASETNADDDEEDDSKPTEPSLIEKFDVFIAHIRGAKVLASKTHRSLSDLRARSLALSPSVSETFVRAEEAADVLALFARSAGETLQSLFGEEGRDSPHSISEVNLALSRLSTSVFKLNTPESSPLVAVANHLRSLTSQLTDIGALTADLENTREFERSPAPWVTRSAELRITKSASVDTEAEIARLTEIVRDRSLLVRAKEQELEEQGVRIETLEARMLEAQKRSAQLGELESSFGTFKQTEKSLRDQLTETHKDVRRLRQERDDLRRTVAEHQAASRDTDAPEADFGGGASRIELERAKAQGMNLKAAIRYLQSQTTVSTKASSADAKWLEEPLFPKPTRQQRNVGLLEAETRSAMSELLSAVVKSKPIKLSGCPSTSRLAWRPAQDTAAWATHKRREEWETWREWQADILTRAGGKMSLHREPSLGAERYLEGVVVVVGEA